MVLPLVLDKMVDVESQIGDLKRRVLDLEHSSGGDDSLLPGRKSGGTDAQVFKKVSTRLQDFEAQITARLSNM